ncbi:MAG: OST-HTH/LOTUS domain-containing protein, partial [Flavitalea sp.]
GWAYMATLGGLLSRKRTDFDPRNYGFPKLLPLIKSLDLFEIDERDSGLDNIKHIYIKLK